ncbi:uncharacterized protein LOC143183040 [Calliopsis andreniformis]|uniref:uncharacterized protein LOC143183040 n=1 Tax=Calliopsis andreniformis TaxID=337506 RepID=UPI003FCC474B
MFLRLILISTVFTFVYTRSVDPREIQPASLLDEPHPEIDMEAEATKTINEERHAPHDHVTLKATHTSPDSTKIDSSHVHLEQKQLKRRSANYKEDHGTDPRPGCCG